MSRPAPAPSYDLASQLKRQNTSVPPTSTAAPLRQQEVWTSSRRRPIVGHCTPSAGATPQQPLHRVLPRQENWQNIDVVSFTPQRYLPQGTSPPAFVVIPPNALLMSRANLIKIRRATRREPLHL